MCCNTRSIADYDSIQNLTQIGDKLHVLQSFFYIPFGDIILSSTKSHRHLQRITIPWRQIGAKFQIFGMILFTISARIFSQVSYATGMHFPKPTNGSHFLLQMLNQLSCVMKLPILARILVIHGIRTTHFAYRSHNSFSARLDFCQDMLAK